MNYDKLTKKKQQLDRLRPLSKELVQNLEDWFRVELTFTSNAIEGNTLTRLETAVVIEKGITIGGKSLREHLEATNHAAALDFVHTLVKRKRSSLSATEILRIHEMILKGIDEANAGRLRNVPVRIAGSSVVVPNPRKVPDLMDDFVEWLVSKLDLHPVALAGEAHYRLVSIHPFVDGNGRTARLLMNLLLLMQGFPPAIIRKTDRLKYIASLEKAQLGGSKADFEGLIAKAVDRSLDIYLQAAQGKTSQRTLDSDEQLIRIGALAKKVAETLATIRYWTKEGLLEVSQTTESGYQLFSVEMISQCKLIQKLKKERLTLAEIKQRLGR